MSSCEDMIANRHYIEDWSVEDGAQFIEDAGFPQYKTTFSFNKVGGTELMLLEQRYLPNLGIRNFVEQKKILKFLQELKKQEDEQKLEDLRAEEEARRREEEEARLAEEKAAWENEQKNAESKEAVQEEKEPESTDAEANISTIKFDTLEQKVRLLQKSPEQLTELWMIMDVNDNGKVSLAEIDRLVVMKYPILNNKAALMRAYKYTTMVEGDKDAWVERDEFPSLLKNVFFYNKLWNMFDLLDSGFDQRLNIDEFSQGLGLLGLQLNKSDAERIFSDIDRNGGGQILFDEFCQWVIRNHWDVD